MLPFDLYIDASSMNLILLRHSLVVFLISSSIWPLSSVTDVSTTSHWFQMLSISRSTLTFSSYLCRTTSAFNAIGFNFHWGLVGCLVEDITQRICTLTGLWSKSTLTSLINHMLRMLEVWHVSSFWWFPVWRWIQGCRTYIFLITEFLISHKYQFHVENRKLSVNFTQLFIKEVLDESFIISIETYYICLYHERKILTAVVCVTLIWSAALYLTLLHTPFVLSIF